ncbi:hypothetical protein, partial [Helicobacter sp. T3_23-1059]
DFISSVEGKNGEYQKDREYFIDKVVEVFEKQKPDSNNKTFSAQYKEIFIESKAKSTIRQRKIFIESLIKTICNHKDVELPLEKVKFYNQTLRKIRKQKTISDGYYVNKEIYINKLHIKRGNHNFYDLKKYPSPKYDEVRDFLAQKVTFMQLLDTVFHELRHFYIEQFIAEPLENGQATFGSLLKYLAISEGFYIDSDIKSMGNIFDKFYKICNENNSTNIGCAIGKKENIYKIQPNERDPRYVATQIIKNLHKKE